MTFNGCIFDADLIAGSSTLFSQGGGSAIDSQASVNILQSTFTGNLASGAWNVVGGVVSASTMSVSDSTFTGNRASGGSVNGGVLEGYYSLTVDDSTFTGSQAVASPGADGEGYYYSAGGYVSGGVHDLRQHVQVQPRESGGRRGRGTGLGRGAGRRRHRRDRLHRDRDARVFKGWPRGFVHPQHGHRRLQVREQPGDRRLGRRRRVGGGRGRRRLGPGRQRLGHEASEHLRQRVLGHRGHRRRRRGGRSRAATRGQGGTVQGGSLSIQDTWGAFVPSDAVAYVQGSSFTGTTASGGAGGAGVSGAPAAPVQGGGVYVGIQPPFYSNTSYTYQALVLRRHDHRQRRPGRHRGAGTSAGVGGAGGSVQGGGIALFGATTPLDPLVASFTSTDIANNTATAGAGGSGGTGGGGGDAQGGGLYVGDQASRDADPGVDHPQHCHGRCRWRGYHGGGYRLRDRRRRLPGLAGLRPDQDQDQRQLRLDGR